jgi:N-acetylneuraminic acid mutarotase
MFAFPQVLRLRVLLMAGLIAATSLSARQLASAQANGANEWTWMGGSSTVSFNDGLPGVYGTLGVPAAGNIPGGRYDAANWTDNSGHLWLFGGQGFYSSDNWMGLLNDLWEFNPSTGQWTWMGGSSTVNAAIGGNPGVYGTLGTPAAGNVPGSRYGASIWTDSSGHLWLFGGQGIDADGTQGYLNDLWEFNPSTNQWIWMGGSSTVPSSNSGQPGFYGTLGVPAAGNIPGSRWFAANWTDNSDNLWLFGGQGYDANGNNYDLNDLWEFNPTTKQWAWMGGSSTMICTTDRSGYEECAPPGVYGTLGTPAAGNVPGGRYEAVRWTDKSGNFWLFGGSGYDAGGDSGWLNDLWEFNPSTKEWAWISGSSTMNCMNYADGVYLCGQLGVYGTLGTPSAGNVPGGRNSAASWIESSGHLWLFGGYGLGGWGLNASGYYGFYGFLNDLWEFNPSTSQWTWMGGNSTTIPLHVNVCCYYGQLGVYDTLGTPAAANIPGSRDSAAIWTDRSGNFWLFGGNGIDASGFLGWMNDLWEYQPSSTPSFTATATPIISPAAGTYTTEQSATISDSTPGATIYYTTDGSTPTTSSTVYSGAITVSATETIQAIAVATNYLNSAVATAAYTITPPAAAPVFSVAAGTYTATQTVTISDTTPGATIYYTTDGTQPAATSSVYSGPIVVSSSETLEAMATASGYTQSAVAAAAYVVNISTNPVPVISSISPATASAGGTAFTLTVNGLEFTANSTIYWGTNVLTTTYVNATQLTAQVTADEIATAGITSITVQTPTPGGGTSSIFQFEIDTASGTTTGTIFSSTTATVASGSPAAYPATLPSSMSSPTVTCLNLPPGATCSYSATTNTVTITTSPTTPAGTYLVTVVFGETVSGAASWILLPILLLPLVLLRRKLAARGVWVTACLGIVLLAAAAYTSGCGGGSSSPPPPQTHQVTSSGVVTLTIH